jgi:hypothetical protein
VARPSPIYEVVEVIEIFVVAADSIQLNLDRMVVPDLVRFDGHLLLFPGMKIAFS